jgi:hypothetical protein
VFAFAARDAAFRSPQDVAAAHAAAHLFTARAVRCARAPPPRLLAARTPCLAGTR